jgi:glutamate synthase (NADPH/NADH) large chain
MSRSEEGQTLLGFREVPVDNSSLSKAEHIAATEPSTRYRCRPTIVYKGMFLADQLGAYYADLHEERFRSALALVHQRFSTNTFPSWSLAHPYRMVAHNGEINTLRGNVNWMAARQASVESELFGKDISKLWPISYEGQSDTACFDNALEFLVQGGYSLPHAVMMLIPEAWAGNPLMDERAPRLLRISCRLMEPWDGPAAVAFTDGARSARRSTATACARRVISSPRTTAS